VLVLVLVLVLGRPLRLGFAPNRRFSYLRFTDSKRGTALKLTLALTLTLFIQSR
jgi:hypothetical protein